MGIKMSVSKIPQCINGEFLADSTGKISTKLVSISQSFKIISDKIRTNSSSENGFIQINAKAVTSSTFNGDDDECNSPCECKPSDKLVDKIYLPNQNKSDSVQKDMVFCLRSTARDIYLEAEGLTSGEKVYVELTFYFFDKLNP